ncbi:MAG TPA: hypothetical protein VGL44_00560 [Gaiellales bacterium]|jgi:anaerobic selenocysteine-containing dehydrogenase
MLVAVLGLALGAALIWLGITTSLRPNEGTSEGPYDLVIAALAVWSMTAIVVPLAHVRAGDLRRWWAAAAVGLSGVAVTAAVLMLAVHVATHPGLTPAGMRDSGTADDRAFLMIAVAPVFALTAAFAGAWILIRPGRAAA